MMGFAMFVLLLLLVGGLYDWKNRSLPVWILVVGGLGGAAGLVFNLLGTEGGVEAWAALLPGAMALLIAYATREQIGYGDGAMLLIMGGCLGASKVVLALTIALLGACVVSILLLVSRRADRNSRIPFVPFLCMGCFVAVMGGLSG